MSRDIKFRAITKDSPRRWVYGDVVTENGKPFAIADHSTEWHTIIPETVGQFTGLKDSNGKDIYEDDLLSISAIMEADYCSSQSGVRDMVEQTILVCIEWENTFAGFVMKTVREDKYMDSWSFGYDDHDAYLNVTGTIHDNLLEDTK